MLDPILNGAARDVDLHAIGAVEQNAQTVPPATDGSEPAVRATQHAVLLAKKLEARLKVVSVETGLDGLYVPDEPVSDANYERLDLAVQGMVLARRLAEANAVPCSVEVLKGPIAGSIIGAATREGASVIVIGDTGRTGLRRLALGSVALAVVKGAEIPVLVAKAS